MSDPRPSPPAAAGPGRGARLVLLASSCLLALGAAELAVRWLAPQALVLGEGFFVADPELGWTLRPGFRGRLGNLVDYDTEVRVDALGLRGGEPAGARPGVLGIGDSFMFGHGLEEDQTFLALAARRAGAEPVNAGVQGYDLCQETDLAARVLVRVAVDAIVVAPCLANDEVDGAEGRHRMEVRDGHFVEPGATFETDSWARRLVHPLFVHSHLVRFLRFSAPVQAFERRAFGRESIDRRALQSLLEAFLAEPTAKVLDGSAREAACALRLAALADAHRVPVLALLVPDEMQIEPGRLAPAQRAAGLEGVRFDLDAPRRRFVALLGTAGIPVVDPSAALGAAARAGRALWFVRDRHFTPAGAAVVADVLAPALARALGAGGAAPGAATAGRLP